jgi:hypothetical protein
MRDAHESRPTAATLTCGEAFDFVVFMEMIRTAARGLYAKVLQLVRAPRAISHALVPPQLDANRPNAT